MPRIQVYTDPEMKRRIQLAAARHNTPVTQYCLEAIEQRLADEGLLDQDKIEIPIKPEESEDLISDLRALRQKILADRDGAPINIDEIIEDVRAGRDDELLSLR